MKKLYGGIFFVFLLALIYLSFRSNPQDQIINPSSTPSTNGDYLEQTPPGKQFVQFAPGVVPPDMYHSVTISPDGQEIYWAARTGIMVTTKRDGRWTTPEVVSFSGRVTDDGYSYDDAPVVSPDNKRLYFNSLRAYGSSPALSRWSFWYCERTPTGWSEPQPLPDIINLTGGIHWQVSVSNSGTLFFGALNSTLMRAAIFYSRLVNGVYTTPEPLSVVNNVGSVLAPFIAPDESYIIFNKEEGGGMTIETYICFRGSDNEWLPPQKMVQFSSMRESSFVTRDGKYIFCKNYWASADIIEDYRPKNITPMINTVIDIDGNIYKTIKIGNQTWMAENLKTTKFNDGTQIPYITDPSVWDNLRTPGYCWYNNEKINGDKLGGIYNWYTVNTKKLAPVGWHIPTQEEWLTLINYLGGEDVAGGKLKGVGTSYWASPNVGATDEFGFTALPSGYRGGGGMFWHLGGACFWWSSTMQSADKAWRISLNYSGDHVDIDCQYFTHGWSIRCIKD